MHRSRPVKLFTPDGELLFTGLSRFLVTPARTLMRSIHPLPLCIFTVWAGALLAALSCRGLSASAGRLPDSWAGVGMAIGFLSVAMVVVGVCYLPARLPRIVSRMVQLILMAGALWSTGTLTRAIFVLTA